MSEKETPGIEEEQTQEAEDSQEVEEVQAAVKNQESSPEEGTLELEVVEDTGEHTEEVEAEIETAAEVPAPKKGLMERRESFTQSSVPNAHKGYSPTPPIIMILIVSAFIIVSLIFATAAVIN
ncbi:MAG: hypothetical protein KAJ31_05130 [Deltaproteobacteria bacterium]|nr:hypothetical protein [Deltaproteobacteria bacterium]